MTSIDTISPQQPTFTPIERTDVEPKGETEPIALRKTAGAEGADRYVPAGGDRSPGQRLAEFDGRGTTSVTSPTAIASSSKGVTAPRSITETATEFLVSRSGTVSVPEGVAAQRVASTAGSRQATSRIDSTTPLKDIPTHAYELQQLVNRLDGAGVPSADVLSRATAAALSHYDTTYPNLTQQQKMDATMRDIAAVFVGPQALSKLRDYRDAQNGLSSTLENVPGLGDWVRNRGDRQTTNSFIEALEQFEQSPRGWPASASTREFQELDNRDIKDTFKDGSDGQIYHGAFYTFMTYATNDPVGAGLGNLQHELAHGGIGERGHGGRSDADYRLGVWGIHLGEEARHARDSGSREDYYALPALSQATYSEAGARAGDPSQPWNQAATRLGYDYRARVAELDAAVRRDVNIPPGQNPANGVVNMINQAMISGRNGIEDFLRDRGVIDWLRDRGWIR